MSDILTDHPPNIPGSARNTEARQSTSDHADSSKEAHIEGSQIGAANKEEPPACLAPELPSHIEQVLTDSLEATPRRSGRVRKAPGNYKDEIVIPAAASPIQAPAITTPRPKRRAAAEADDAIKAQEDTELVTDVICKPMTPEERKGFKGWVELESEPMFFQAMLHEMGAADLKISELLSIDEDSVNALPQPVHGLVFLFAYEDSDTEMEVDREDCPPGLWFANQTTANACATVALMNIAMNVQEPELGPELQQFKEQTINLSPPQRGYALDTHDFIRCIHNSTARRTQLIYEDLALKNRVEDWEKEKRKRERAIKNPKSRARKGGSSRPSSGGKKKKKKQHDLDESSNHYIAYVPFGGKVWELDGLEKQPLCLGSYGADQSWLQAAIEVIQVRMAAGNYPNAFNLLAVSRSPVQSLVARLAANPADDAPQQQQQEQIDPQEEEDPDGDASMQINPRPSPSTSSSSLLPRATALVAERSAVEDELRAERAGQDAARRAWAARQLDWTPFVHRFLRTLADKGVLMQMLADHAE